MTQIFQCTIPHSPYPNCYKTNAGSANSNRQFFPGNFSRQKENVLHFSSGRRKNILPGTNFLRINGVQVAELDLLYRNNKQQSSKQLQYMYM